MKKLKIIIATIFFLLISPVIANAATSLSASTQTPTVGSIIYVELDIDYGHEELIKDAHYIIEYDTEQFELDEVIWTQSKGTYKRDSGKLYIDKTDDTKSWEYGGQVILKLKVLSQGQNKISIKENGVAHYVDGSVVSQTFSGITINAVAPSADTVIGSLSVEGYTISPTFSKSTYEYNLTVPSNVSSVNVIAKKGNSTQVITGDGTRELVYGDNRVRVQVKAENGESRTYEIMIHRTDDRTGDTSLLNLSVSNTNIKYDEDKTIYYATVSRSVDSVLISARATDSAASLAGTGTKSLEVGRNVFDVTVESSDNQTKTYTIVITRSETEIEPNVESTNLASLNINSRDIELEQDKTNYLMGVDSDTKNLVFDYTTESETATVTIEGGQKLVEGLNVVKIKVTEANEQYKEYRIIVYRNPENYTFVGDLEDYESENEDIIYNSKEDSDHVLTTKEVKKIKENKSIVHYNVVNDDKGIIYGLTINNDLMDTLYEFKTNFDKISDTPLTYNTELPKGVEVMLYVGDIYMDNMFVKVYTYNNLGQYTLLTDGISVKDGYITFETNGEQNYVITTAQLIKNKVSPLKWLKENFIKIIAVIAIVGVIAYIVYKKFKKKNPPVSSEPY